MNTILHQNRLEDTQNWTNLCLEPHDYRIHYVSIDLRRQYGISVAKSQTFLLAKRPQRRRARRNGCFRRLLSLLSISVYPKSREKRNGGEVEREGISRHHRIYDRIPSSSDILIDKKQTEKVRLLGKNQGLPPKHTENTF